MTDDQKEELINHIVWAVEYYERIRYGNDNKLSFDAALDEVLKQMGLEE